MNRRLFVLAAFALAGCASLPAATIDAPAGAGFEELESLYLARADRTALTIRVSSNGCTQKSDFAFFVQRQGGGVRLAFGRRKLDTCKSFAAGHADLAFTWAELGVAPQTPLFLLNPLVAWSGPGS
jgi:hypothetical protein